MTILSLSTVFAFAAWVWIAVLCQPRGLFERVPVDFVKMGLNPEGKVMYVLFQCEKCFAGQLSLWGYPLLCFAYDAIFWPWDWFCTVILSIAFAAFISKIYNRL